MKAYVLKSVGNLVYEDVDYPQCPNDWAIVKVRAAGICSSDIPRIFTKGTYHFPTIPGHEFSGVVDKVSNEKYSSFVGKPVGVFPLIPCKRCVQCEKEKYELCSSYDYVGSRRDGAFAEYVAVPIWNLVEFPFNVSFTDIALLEPLSVALHAVKRADIKQGQNVAIVGTGMIGFAAAQWAQFMGAGKVYVMGRSEEKRAFAQRIPNIDYITNLSYLKDVDVVIEAVGTSDSINTALSIVSPEGVIVLMGNPEGTIVLPQNDYWKVLRKQITTFGTWNSSYAGTDSSDWTMARDALIKDKIKARQLISHVVNQEDLLDGLLLMKEHQEPYCKVMSLWNE